MTSKYIYLKNKLARLVGLQKSLKTRRRTVNLEVASVYGRFARNGGRYDGRDLVPRQAAYDLVTYIKDLGVIERRILKVRNDINVVLEDLELMRTLRAYEKRHVKSLILEELGETE